MDYKEFENGLKTNSQRYIVKVYWIVFAAVLTLELLIFFSYLKLTEIDVSLTEYILLRIVFPTVINLSALLVSTFIVRSDKYTVKQKDYTVCMTLSLMCLVVSVVHEAFEVLWCIPCLSIFLTPIFGDRTLAKRVYVIANISVFLSMLMSFRDFPEEWLNHVIYAVVCIVMTWGAYLIANVLTGFQKEQFGYIYNSYLRQKELIEEMQIEPLTKLYNRKVMDSMLDVCINNVDENSNYVAAMVDVDHFKRINDTYGHLHGDEVLVRLSDIMREEILTDETVGFRYGGEEFLILFTGKDIDSAYRIMDNFRKRFEKEKFTFMKGKKVTFSCGIAALKPNQTKKMWLQISDTALYKAKEEGRNRVEIGV